MSDLGDIHHFLGVNVTRNTSGLFLCQQKYVLEILDRANMLNCNPISTPIDTKAKLSAHDGDPLSNPTLYRSLTGALQYLTLTRPDISYAVQHACLFMHAPRSTHFQLIKRILRYLQGTSHFGIQIYKSPSHELIAYSDADWAGCPDTRKSTSGFCVFLGSNLVSWSSKRQATVSRSSAEAEYHAVANCVAKTTWLRQLLQELRRPQLALQWCTVITLVRRISLRTPCSTSEPNMWRSICISFGTGLLWERPEFCTFLPAPNMQIFSPRASLQQFSLIFEPV